TGRQCFSFHIFHGEEIDWAVIGLGGVNLINTANIVVSNVHGGAGFRRQAPLKAGLGAFQGAPLLQPLVHGFVNNSHSALGQFANNTKAAKGDIPRLKGVLKVAAVYQRVEEKVPHAFLPLELLPHSAKQFQVRTAGVTKKCLLFIGCNSQSSLKQAHESVVALDFFVFHPSDSKRSNNHLRASSHRRCAVRSGRCKASAASSSVRPRKYLSSTIAH